MGPARRHPEPGRVGTPGCRPLAGRSVIAEAEGPPAMAGRDRVAPRALVPKFGRGFLFSGGVDVVAITAANVVDLVPVTRERLADLETPVSAFAKLRALGGAFLLESAEGGERMGRFSFIGVAPRETLYFRDGEVSINTWTNPDRDPRGAGWLAAYPAADPIVALREHMRGYRRAPQTGLPRFSGGAVGFVSYEVARRFERLPLARNDPY